MAENTPAVVLDPTALLGFATMDRARFESHCRTGSREAGAFDPRLAMVGEFRLPPS